MIEPIQKKVRVMGREAAVELSITPIPGHKSAMLNLKVNTGLGQFNPSVLLEPWELFALRDMIENAIENSEIMTVLNFNKG